MKNSILIFALLICFSNISLAQFSLAHHFPKPNGTESQIVNLSISGKKIMTVFNQNSVNTADTLYFYNMDYSFWKSIPCPAIPGFGGRFNIHHDLGMDVGIYYPSETLFNLDTFLEVVVLYRGSGGIGKFLVINETGTIVDSIVNVGIYPYPFSVFKVDTLGIGFQAVVSTPTGVDVYNLPGTLPCNACYYGIGATTSVEKTDYTIPTLPIPNPSSDKVKITFTLPDGAKRGELNLYNTNGQKIKTYQVDDRFGYVMLDNSQLPSGLYYYNIVANGEISSTQKLVLIK